MNRSVMLALPLIYFSGWAIVGNAVLNVLGKVVMTDVAQLVVPLVAILAVVFLSDSYAVQAVMLGMVIGQLLYLLILEFNLRKHGYTLLPRYDVRNRAPLNRLASQYFPLIDPEIRKWNVVISERQSSVGTQSLNSSIRIVRHRAI
jgi:peptidoglycan biosynthesis protein MviN/MurJ (putative lipid II flippase)